MKAYDNNTYSGEVKWNISVKVKEGQLAGNRGREDIAILLLIAAIALLIIIVMIAATRKRKEMEKKTTQPRR